MKNHLRKIKFEYKITFFYLVIGCLWILFSDKILYFLISDAYLLTEFQTFKGWFYVIVTSILLYFVLQKHLVRIRTAEQKAKENDRLKSAFLQNISHEIRTPMNGIIGFAGLMTDPNLSDIQKNQFLEIITKSSNQLLKTINDVLDISQIETGSLKTFEEHIHLNNFLDQVYLNYKPLIHEDLSFTVQKGLPDEQCIVTSDEGKIRQIIYNLLNNANKFTEEGHIKIGYSVVNKELEFFIEDSGIGINPNFHQKIFEHFLKAELENSKLYEGLGLGLAICKGNVELLHGKIWVKSEINKGSTFYFTIPYKPAIDKENESIENNRGKKKPNKLTLLVVEDEPSNYIYIKQILEGTGSTIYHALNGKEAIEICKRDNEITLVLMDIKMPVMNGYDATRMIREIRPNITIIAQTGYAMKGEREMALKAGFSEYITKPFKREQILALIENIK